MTFLLSPTFPPGPLHVTPPMVYLIREDGRLRVETDRHILGLFALDVWRETLTDAGFTIHQEKYAEGGKEYATFTCLKPR